MVLILLSAGNAYANREGPTWLECIILMQFAYKFLSVGMPPPYLPRGNGRSSVGYALALDGYGNCCCIRFYSRFYKMGLCGPRDLAGRMWIRKPLLPTFTLNIESYYNLSVSTVTTQGEQGSRSVDLRERGSKV